MFANFLSVGIDVGSAFSFMSIVNPSGKLVSKPFKIIHNSQDALARAACAIKKAEEFASLRSRTFLESTAIYHIALFCYLHELGLNVPLSILSSLILSKISVLEK